MSWNLSFSGGAADGEVAINEQYETLKKAERNETEYKDIDRAKDLLLGYCSDHPGKTINASASGHAGSANDSGEVSASLKFS
jgi:hypothetical protein